MVILNLIFFGDGYESWLLCWCFDMTLTCTLIACYFHHVGDCTFENSFCGWRNSKTDNYDWVLQSGSYSGTAPHPSGDHTFGAGKGQCIYFHIIQIMIDSCKLLHVQKQSLAIWCVNLYAFIIYIYSDVLQNWIVKYSNYHFIFMWKSHEYMYMYHIRTCIK